VLCKRNSSSTRLDSTPHATLFGHGIIPWKKPFHVVVVVLIVILVD
jgi:hypothetical protein